MKNVIVVGSGLGGLSAALRLATKGYKVQIIEKNNIAGGRLNQIKSNGFTFDTGPSFFSMSYEFDEFARDCNIKLPFEFVELDPLYSVNFSNNSKTFFLYKDIKKLALQFNEFEPDFEQKMERYLKKTGSLFHDTVDLVIKNNFDSVLQYFLTLVRVNPAHLPVLFRTFWQQVCLHFTSEQARQIISLVAFFLGRTPFDTMGIYSLLSYTEFKHNGYYNVKGGMYQIVTGLLNELKKHNVEIIYNTEITGFDSVNGKITNLTNQYGNKHVADIFLINADAAVFRGTVLKQKKYSEQRLDKMKWTMGYLTFYIGVNCKLPQAGHHNYYLGTNYQDYAAKVLTNPNTPEKPYYYVNVLSRFNTGCAPDGCETLFFVCPVPNLMQKPNWDDKDQIVDSIIADFSKRINKNIVPHIVTKTIYTPANWQQQFNLYKGSGLGLAHNFMQIGAFRPQNFDKKYKNVFYTGASTIPGAGLPMAIISSKLACQRIYNYRKNL